MGYIVIKEGVSRPIPEFALLETLLLNVKCIHTPCTVVSTLPLLLVLLLAKSWGTGTLSGNLIQKPRPPLRWGVLHQWALAHTHNWSVFIEYLLCTCKIHMLWWMGMEWLHWWTVVKL